MLYTRVGLDAEHAYLHTSLSVVLSSIGEPRTALWHCLQALALYQAAGNQSGIIFSIADIGTAQQRLGQHEAAIISLSKAAALAREGQYANHEGQVMLALGRFHAELGDHQQALANLRVGLDRTRRAGHRPQEADLLVALGDVWSTRGDREAARDAWLKARTIFDALKLTNRVQEVNRRLATLWSTNVEADLSGDHRTEVDRQSGEQVPALLHVNIVGGGGAIKVLTSDVSFGSRNCRQRPHSRIAAPQTGQSL